MNDVIQIFPQRLRYSTLETLYTCERKFELDNLLSGTEIREESEHLSFGTAYGVGIAHYLIHQDQDAALFQAFMAYWPVIETDKKNEVLMLAAMMNSFAACDDLLQDYEVLIVNGKPAAELTFRLEIDEGFYFTGAIDIVLKNKYNGVHYVMDVKTTGLMLTDVSPIYANSGQTLGYSVAVDALVGEELTSYGVLYFVCQMNSKNPGGSKIHVLPFEKTLLDRLNWFLTLKMDVERIKQMQSLGVFPKRGGSCLHYMRPCKYFGTCGLHGLDKKKITEEDKTVYDLNFALDDLIENHIKRIERMETIL
jgi:hypothetical protein